MASTLNTVGVTLEIVGLGIAFLGAWQTWGDLAESGERPWSFAVRAIRAGFLAAMRNVRRLLRRPDPQVIEVGGIATGLSFGKARLRLGYGPIADDIDAALKQLDERTRKLRLELEDEEFERIESVEKLEVAISEAAQRAADDFKAWRESIVRTTVSGLRTQFLGFPIVLVGLLLQALAGLDQ